MDWRRSLELFLSFQENLLSMIPNLEAQFIKGMFTQQLFIINSLPNNIFFDYFESKAFTENKMNVIQKLKLALGRVENIVGKGENAAYQNWNFLWEG